MKFFKRIVIALLIQMLCLASIIGQKYQNGTKLLKGAEVLSATPLQLDYVLDQLADTANIKVNLHEGKTHLILNDGSGEWREWWYYKNHWRVKTQGASKETDPVWLADKDKYYTGSDLKTSGKSQVHWSNITNKPPLGAGSVTYVGLSLPDIFTLTGSPVTGSGTITANLASQPKNTVLAAPVAAPGVPVFRILQESDIPNINWTKITGKPTTIAGFGITDAYTKTETRKLVGDTAKVLRNLIRENSIMETDPTVPAIVKNITLENITNWNNALKTESDPVWTSAKGNYHTKNELQTSGKAQVHWDNISNKPSMMAGTVTSVGLSLPDVFTVTGSPVTGTGTLAASLKTQAKNTVWAAPVSGNGLPSFRALHEADLPGINWTKITDKPDLYTKTETKTLVGDTAKNLRALIKANGTETDPVWTGVQENYYTKSNLQTSGQAQVNWGNISNKINASRGTAGLIAYPTGTTTNRYLSEDGSWKIPSSTVSPATTTNLGGIKVGSGLLVTADGTLSTASNIVQEIGQSPVHVISQKGVTNMIFQNYEITKIKIGYGDQKVGNNSISIGLNAVASQSCIAIGAETNASQDSNIAIGNMASAKGGSPSLAIGCRADASGKQTTSLGLNATAIGEFSVALGAYTETTASDIYTLSVGSEARPQHNRRIINMAPGKKPTDAVNMAQLDLRGKVYAQATEPLIPNGSFAFWVTPVFDFYLILHYNGVQRKVPFQ